MNKTGVFAQTGFNDALMTTPGDSAGLIFMVIGFEMTGVPWPHSALEVIWHFTTSPPTGVKV